MTRREIAAADGGVSACGSGRCPASASADKAHGLASNRPMAWRAAQDSNQSSCERGTPLIAKDLGGLVIDVREESLCPPNAWTIRRLADASGT